MVETGQAYFTKYGSMHRTLEEALKAEVIETEKAFCDRVSELAKSNCKDNSWCGLRDAAYYIYKYPRPFLQALDEFGFFDPENLIEEGTTIEES